MRRSELKRKTPLRMAGPAKTSVPVFKPRKCNTVKGGCGQTFVPAKQMQCACGVPCSIAMVDKANAKKAARAALDDRKAMRVKLDGMKTISTLEDECRQIVQKIARIRDRNDGCISCHMGPNYGGVWHGSHYRAHGGCSSLQMHLWNIHKACAQCNLFKGGNKDGFIAGLLIKPGYGRGRLEWLDAQPKSKRFERDYLIRFKAVMGRRLRRMEKRNG